MAKVTSLRQVKTENDVCALPRDHYGFQNWRIMTNGFQVWIAKQKIGEEPTHQIEIPKGTFDRLLALYEREQKPRTRKSQ